MAAIDALTAGNSSDPTNPANKKPKDLKDLDINQFLQLMIAELTNQAIASRLVLSEKTVRNHVSNVFMKLQVGDRATAIVRAREAGLGGVPRCPA